MKNSLRGFTFVELMIVVALVGILASAIYANFNSGGAQARDAQRMADLRNIQSALELYKNKWGRYPEGCNGPTTQRLVAVWSGQVGTNYACPGGETRYILGATSRYFDEFMPVLPTDPKLNGSDSGYVYTVNQAGSVYKLMALKTLESKEVEFNDEFSRCGDMSQVVANATDAAKINECSFVPSNPNPSGAYQYNFAGGGGQIPPCDTPANRNATKKDLALSGGYAGNGIPKANEYYTDIIRCR